MSKIVKLGSGCAASSFGRGTWWCSVKVDYKKNKQFNTKIINVNNVCEPKSIYNIASLRACVYVILTVSILDEMQCATMMHCTQ